MKQAARVAPATCPSKMRCQIGGFPTPAAKSVVTERQGADGHCTSMLCAAGVREPRKRHRILLRYAHGSIRAIYFMRNMQTELPPDRPLTAEFLGKCPMFGGPAGGMNCMPGPMSGFRKCPGTLLQGTSTKKNGVKRKFGRRERPCRRGGNRAIFGGSATACRSG